MIIATKLHIPRTRTALVTRPRLIHRLQQGLDCVLTLVIAPAGYGKTTLLSEWCSTLKHSAAWVSLDQGDNDHMRFWGHTIAALKQTYPDFDEQTVLRHAGEDTSGDSLIAALVNGLHRVSQPLVLVWDDFHHINEATIVKGIDYLLERLPPHVHLYIASRTTPSLALSRIRVKDGLNRLEASDLRFDSKEISEFLVKCGRISLSPEESAVVQERTEGWVAAMRLAVLSVQEHADPSTMIRKMTGKDRDISNYFLDEVFSRQPASLQQFLLQTSILERMTGELCQAVTGMSESDQYLQRLEQESLFLVPLDEWGEWYRYHHLFQQFLQAQLKIRYPNQWKSLHIAAGKWMEEKGYLYEAIDHYLAATSYEDALQLLEVIAPKRMLHEWRTLCHWLGAIPDSLLFARPTIYLTKIAAQYLSGQIDEATDLYWRAIRKLEEDTSFLSPDAAETLRGGLSFLAAFRTFLDRDFDYAIQFSREYVEKYSTLDVFIGFGSDEDGYHPLWDIYVSDDSLRLAEEILPPLLSMWSETKNGCFVAHLCIDIGKLQYERNRLDKAESYMRQAYDIGKMYENLSLITIAALWLARIAAVQGERKIANAMMQEVDIQNKKRTGSHLARKIAWFRLMLGRMQGEEQIVLHWLQTSDLRSQDEIPLSMIKEYDMLACLLAEQGKIEEAAALIERLLFITSQTGRQSDKIRLLVHKSMILFWQEKLAESMDVLEEALFLAWPEGYVRTFVDEGKEMRQLLSQYIEFRQDQHHRSGRKVPLTYVKRLLRLTLQSEAESGSDLLPIGHMPSLTAREQCVLRLMETGMSNKEIAHKLNVSLSTIKTHINNMYSKLQAKNRLQALERARTLRLF